jgi:hypothetical protein
MSAFAPLVGLSGHRSASSIYEYTPLGRQGGHQGFRGMRINSEEERHESMVALCVVGCFACRSARCLCPAAIPGHTRRPCCTAGARNSGLSQSTIEFTAPPLQRGDTGPIGRRGRPRGGPKGDPSKCVASVRSTDPCPGLSPLMRRARLFNICQLVISPRTGRAIDRETLRLAFRKELDRNDQRPRFVAFDSAGPYRGISVFGFFSVRSCHAPLFHR